MSLENIHFQSLTSVAKQIESGAVSPVAVAEAILSRIEKYDPGLKSYTTVTADLALRQAKAAETEIAKGIYRGPMHGIPIAVKDLCFTKGITTTGGMKIYEDFKPDYDATVVTKLAEAGAVLLGKLHMTEGATIEHHPDMPEPVNPWKKTCGRASPPPAPASRRRPASPMRRSAPTPAARSAFPRPATH